MRFQVRTTSLQQRSADLSQASGCSAFIPFRSITPQQVDKSTGKEHRWKYTLRKLDAVLNLVNIIDLHERSPNAQHLKV
ncbi:hypothetical protein NQZ68_010582 [Dissostichus eleginoides]|nr:hypothetical protein NQZ68_010582 [Dissostichus eleginoides]